jgi:hypothetical protein
MSQLSDSNTLTGTQELDKTAEEQAEAAENMSGDGYTRVNDFDPNDKISEYFVRTGNKYDEYGTYIGFDNDTRTPEGYYIQKWIFSKKTLERHTVSQVVFSRKEGIKIWPLYKKKMKTTDADPDVVYDKLLAEVNAATLKIRRFSSLGISGNILLSSLGILNIEIEENEVDELEQEVPEITTFIKSENGNNTYEIPRTALASNENLLSFFSKMLLRPIKDGGSRKRSSILSRKRSKKHKYLKKSRNKKRKSKRRRSSRR